MKTHAISLSHKTETVCGFPARRHVIAPLGEVATCKRCSPPPVQHAPQFWPGYPGRCEYVIRGPVGLELCGQAPCGTHAQ